MQRDNINAHLVCSNKAESRWAEGHSLKGLPSVCRGRICLTNHTEASAFLKAADSRLKKLDVRLRLQRRATFAGGCILRLRCQAVADEEAILFKILVVFLIRYESTDLRNQAKQTFAGETGGQDGSKQSHVEQSWFACQEEYCHLLGYYNLHKSL